MSKFKKAITTAIVVVSAILAILTGIDSAMNGITTIHRLIKNNTEKEPKLPLALFI